MAGRRERKRRGKMNVLSKKAREKVRAKLEEGELGRSYSLKEGV